MSDELESVGALATATLAASTLDGTHDNHVNAAEHGPCANCGAAIAGPFCRMCGQSAHIHRSLLHLIEEVLHGVWHFDAKGWRTIPLLAFFPGRLTRRYIDGQRKNYVSPLALFLFMVFLMFFVASLGGNKPKGAESAADRQARFSEAGKDVEIAKKAVAEASADLEQARKQGAPVEGLQEALNEAINDQKEADASLKQMSAVPLAPPEQVPMDKKTVADEKADKDQDVWVRIADKIKTKGALHSSVPAFDEAVRHALANPELTLYKLKNTTYKYSFLLVPISLPFLWLMFFWRRGIAMFDHAVFVLYSLSFMSLLFVVLTLLGMAGMTVPIVLLAVFAPPAHMFVQLRGTYGLSVFSALWRTAALTCVAGVVLLLFMLLVLMMSVH